MATTRKTITLIDKQDKWIKAQISSGDYINESEYMRNLIRKDQAERGQPMVLKAAI